MTSTASTTSVASMTSTASFHQKTFNLKKNIYFWWFVIFYYLKKAPKSQNNSKLLGNKKFWQVTNAAGNACLISCADGGETSDGNGDHQCDSKCAESAQILNSLGDKCVPDCSAINYILNSQETKCILNCTSEGIVYVCRLGKLSC